MRRAFSPLWYIFFNTALRCCISFSVKGILKSAVTFCKKAASVSKVSQRKQIVASKSKDVEGQESEPQIEDLASIPPQLPDQVNL